jgi:hypothetical protein
MAEITVDEWAFKAILDITKDSEVCFSVIDGKIVDWELIKGEDEKPTEVEIANKVSILKNDYDSKQYRRDRKLEYPEIGDQLDKIYHEGIDAWKADMILPVKNKYPKL